jgi:hypothetical protein
MQEWSTLSAHELIEPKSARTSQISCGRAATVREHRMSDTCSSYARNSRPHGLFRLYCVRCNSVSSVTAEPLAAITMASVTQSASLGRAGLADS